MDTGDGRRTGPVLVVDGEVERPLRLDFADLAQLPSVFQVDDVSAHHPGRRGGAIDLESLLGLASTRVSADHLTLHAGRDDFHVSIPLAEIRDRGMIVYRLGSEPLKTDEGGPYRFLIRDPASCHSAALDDCANVKYLDRIELTVGPGRDTRPVDEASHAALHGRQAGEARTGKRESQGI